MNCGVREGALLEARIEDGIVGEAAGAEVAALKLRVSDRGVLKVAPRKVDGVRRKRLDNRIHNIAGWSCLVITKNAGKLDVAQFSPEDVLSISVIEDDLSRRRRGGGLKSCEPSIPAFAHRDSCNNSQLLLQRSRLHHGEVAKNVRSRQRGTKGAIAYMSVDLGREDAAMSEEALHETDVGSGL